MQILRKFHVSSLATILAMAMLLFACVAPSFYLAEDAPAGGDLQHLIVLPLNFDYSPPPELADGVDILTDELDAFLEGNGREREWLYLSDTVDRWKNAVAMSGGIEAKGETGVDMERYELAREHLARLCIEDHPADGVVMAALLVRRGSYQGTKIKWDGVKRNIEIRGEKRRELIKNMSGLVSVTSLRVTLFDAKGKKVFERYAGLEPMVYLTFKQTRGYYRFQFINRMDLFEDAAILQDTIRLAFRPVIVAPSN